MEQRGGGGYLGCEPVDLEEWEEMLQSYGLTCLAEVEHVGKKLFTTFEECRIDQVCSNTHKIGMISAPYVSSHMNSQPTNIEKESEWTISVQEAKFRQQRGGEQSALNEVPKELSIENVYLGPYLAIKEGVGLLILTLLVESKPLQRNNWERLTHTVMLY